MMATGAKRATPSTGFRKARTAGAPTAAVHKKARKDGRPFNPGSATKLAQIEKERRVLDLRLKGFSYDEIGEAMGIPGITAHAITMRLLDRFEGELKEKVEQARHQELERLRRYLKSLDPACERGDVKAIRVATQISERISRLRGLDAPQVSKLVGEGKDGAISVEVFRSMIAEEPADAGSSEAQK